MNFALNSEESPLICSYRLRNEILPTPPPPQFPIICVLRTFSSPDAGNPSHPMSVAMATKGKCKELARWESWCNAGHLPTAISADMFEAMHTVKKKYILKLHDLKFEI